MSRVIWFVVVAAAMGACTKADEGLKSLEGVQGAVCGCKPSDLACAKDGLAKVATWHEQYAKVEGAKSQAAKATAMLDAIGSRQTQQVLAAIPERAGCAKLDKDAKAAARWCKVAGWGDAEVVEAKDLPFGAKLEGEHVRVTLGMEPAASIPTTLAIAGTAEEPTASGAKITAAGAAWTWQDGDASVELRRIDGGWMALTIDGDTRGVSVFDAP